MTALTPLDIGAIKARADAATPGPWIRFYEGSHDWVIGRVEDPQTSAVAQVYEYAANNYEADTAFIAAARTDVPALVAEVERLHKALTDLKRDHDASGCYFHECNLSNKGYVVQTCTCGAQEHNDRIDNILLGRTKP